VPDYTCGDTALPGGATTQVIVPIYESVGLTTKASNVGGQASDDLEYLNPWGAFEAGSNNSMRKAQRGSSRWLRTRTDDEFIQGMMGLGGNHVFEASYKLTVAQPVPAVPSVDDTGYAMTARMKINNLGAPANHTLLWDDASLTADYFLSIFLTQGDSWDPVDLDYRNPASVDLFEFAVYHPDIGLNDGWQKSVLSDLWQEFTWAMAAGDWYTDPTDVTDLWVWIQCFGGYQDQDHTTDANHGTQLAGNDHNVGPIAAVALSYVSFQLPGVGTVYTVPSDPAAV